MCAQLIKGKLVFDNYYEMLNPSHTAILVIDMQKDGCDPNGYFGRKGANVGLVASIIPNLAKFLDLARSQKVKVIYVNQITLKNGLSDSPAWLYLKKYAYKLIPPADKPEDDYMIEETEGQKVVEDLTPKTGDIIVEKSRASGFINTSLNLILHSNGIQTLVITGESSYGCVLNTLMDASCYDYYTVVARDLIIGPNEELHQLAMRLIQARYICLASGEIINEWNKY